MSETRRCCFWRERAYSTITSVFDVPSFTSEPKISINGWNRGERKQHNNVNISVNTCVESFRARKQIFEKFYTL